MKFRRIQQVHKSNCHIAAEINEEWCIINEFSGSMMEALLVSDAELQKYKTQPYSPEQYKTLIPLRPAAYRDFMLYEKHAIDAARGFVNKYLPGLKPVVTVYETLFRSPFPKLKPHARYYRHPIYYMGNHLNFFTDRDEIPIPEYTEQLDYELEIAAILIKSLKNASPDEVNQAIGGFVILNDFSARDVQLDEMKSGFGPVKSKNFGSAISTDVIVSRFLINRLDSLKTSVFINDELIISSTSGGNKYSFQEAIAYASWEEQLHPGELFGSGTIPGCSGIENGRMLNKGDTIKFEVEGMGSLTNTII